MTAELLLLGKTMTDWEAEELRIESRLLNKISFNALLRKE